MIILRAFDRRASLWKNGLGQTREVAAHPPNSNLEDFVWRVSLATVEAGGPFSHFRSVDRTLAVLAGRLSLTIAGKSHALGPDSAPITFPGDADVQGDILEGPVTDLNLMTRRGQARGGVERISSSGTTEIRASATTLVLAPVGGLRVESATETVELAPLDAVLLDRGDAPVRLHSPLSTDVYVVRID